jgi:hypothetical protein
VVSIPAGSGITQREPIEGGEAYLLVAKAMCAKPTNQIRLALHWLAADGRELSAAAEAVAPGSTGSEQFLWNLAPDDATGAIAEISAQSGGKCQVDEAGLYRQ